MKSNKMIAACFSVLVLVCAAFGLSGCASTKAHSTESMLSAAGFHTITPTTPQQQACYDALPAYKIERTETENGRVAYAYADKNAGLLYVGNENNYQRFSHMAVQQKIAEEQVAAAQMNQSAAANWGSWSLDGMWW